MSLPLLGGGQGHGAGGGGGGGGAGAEATAFLARTSGLDGTHTTAYTNLINGLVTDGLWSKLDMLHVYATQDTTTAQLNLVSTSYPATLVGPPSFTADRGYDSSGSGQYIRTGFIPSTATTPNFVQNSAHISIWPLNNAVGGFLIMGANDGAGANMVGLHARYADNNFHPYVNAVSESPVAVADSIGHYICNRSTSSAVQGYKNGSSVVTNNAINSTGLTAKEIAVIGQNDNGSFHGQLGYQVSMSSIGSSMNSTEAGNFYSRLRTYMTAVGVP